MDAQKFKAQEHGAIIAPADNIYCLDKKACVGEYYLPHIVAQP
jgi:hypothetical protein